MFIDFGGLPRYSPMADLSRPGVFFKNLATAFASPCIWVRREEEEEEEEERGGAVSFPPADSGAVLGNSPSSAEN